MVDWEAFYAAFRRPDFIPGYEIQNHLGGGAFGEVYKARKTSIGKAYAIKFLRLDDIGQKDAVERELDQVRHFASIDHPNLVTIEDMGVVHGVPYLVMGYAGEDTLARRIKRGDLDSARALRYVVQACRGVLALHDRRLAHFDLKPSNVFIKGDVARVGDYGLAKLLTEGRQTLSFGRGTPQYMAPEMLKNRADHRADIYSLGVILFESLAFRLPYGEGAVGVLVRDEDHPPDFPADFSPETRPIVARCLRIDPADRFPAVTDLLEALGQPARQGDSVRLRVEDLSERTKTLQSQGAEPGAEQTRSTSEDLRRAAAELARGAVGVARGVWGGVVERVSSSATPEREGAKAPDEGPSVPEEQPGDGTTGEDVVSVSTLDEPGQASAADLEARVSTTGEAPWRRELERMRGERPRPDGPALLVSENVRTRSVAGTVPVPPRAAGGWVGNVSQSLIVGTEIMGALPLFNLQCSAIGNSRCGIKTSITETIGFLNL